MADDLKQKFQELREKHHVIFPQIRDKSVNFTISDPDNPPYTRKNTIRFMYAYDDLKGWGLVIGTETGKSKAYMDDLINSGIITMTGKANYIYPFSKPRIYILSETEPNFEDLSKHPIKK